MLDKNSHDQVCPTRHVYGNVFKENLWNKEDLSQALNPTNCTVMNVGLSCYLSNIDIMTHGYYLHQLTWFYHLTYNFGVFFGSM